MGEAVEELERDLGADPKLNSAMSKAARPRGRWTWAFIGILIGLGVLVGGVMAQAVIIGIVGFAIMLGAALWGMLAPTKKSAAKAAPTAAPKKAKRQGFMNRVEERFERRRDQGDF